MVVKKRQCGESARAYLVPDSVCFFSGQVSEGAERSEASVPVERLLATLLSALFSTECLASFPDSIRKRMCVDGECGFWRECANGVSVVRVCSRRVLFYLKRLRQGFESTQSFAD